MQTKRVGNTAEAKALAKFVSFGWVVLLPFGDTEPYDLVIDRGNGFETVQVKNGRDNVAKDGIVFNAYSMSGRISQEIKLYIGIVDLFAVYYPALDAIYLLPVKDCPVSRPTLSLRETLAHPEQGRLANDYLLP